MSQQLEARLTRAFRDDGLEELIVRVSRYDDNMKPTTYQAIARYRGRREGPPGVGIRANETAAILAALDDGARLARGANLRIVTEDEGVFG